MKKKLTIVLCAFLAALVLPLIVAPLVTSAAKTSANQYSNNADVKAFQATIDKLEKEQTELKNKLKNIQNQRYSAQQQANDLANLILNTEKKVEVTESLLKALETQIADKEKEISDKEVEIEAKQAEVTRTRERFLMLVRAQYENDETSILSVVIGADSISDLLSRVEYMSSILEYNSKLLASYKAEKQKLEDMKAVLEASKGDLESDFTAQSEYMDTLEKEVADLELQKAGQDKYIQTLRMSEAEIQAEYNAAKKAEEEENARLEKLLRELAAKDKTE